MGDDLVLLVFNEQAHIGAVALADIDQGSKRAWASVLSSAGHREDKLAHELSLKVCRSLRRRVCVIAGIHVDDITPEEIADVLTAARAVTNQFIEFVRDMDDYLEEIIREDDS